MPIKWDSISVWASCSSCGRHLKEQEFSEWASAAEACAFCAHQYLSHCSSSGHVGPAAFCRDVLPAFEHFGLPPWTQQDSVMIRAFREAAAPVAAPGPPPGAPPAPVAAEAAEAAERPGNVDLQPTVLNLQRRLSALETVASVNLQHEQTVMDLQGRLSALETVNLQPTVMDLQGRLSALETVSREEREWRMGDWWDNEWWPNQHGSGSDSDF